MKRKQLASLLLATVVALPVTASAGVVMCVDPQTGRKTFTDHACPNATDTSRKVRVEPVNFGGGKMIQRDSGVWASDRDQSVSGTENFASDYRAAESKAPAVGVGVR